MEHYNDIQLLDAIGAIEAQLKTLDNEQSVLKAELLKRHKASGELSIQSAEWESLMKKAPISLAWLKREFGYEPQDLPDGIIGEKIVPDLNPAALLAWLEQDGSKIEQPYTIQIKRVKAK